MAFAIQAPDFLFFAWLGKPIWLWLTFASIVTAMLAADLGLFHKKDREMGIGESLVFSSVYIGLGLLFGVWVAWYLGTTAGIEYFTGFAIEKALAIDNVFVIAMIFTYFGVPARYQHRVLFWGILGAIVLRGIMIGLGAALISSMHWILYLFAAFLIFTGIKMLTARNKAYDISTNPVLKLLRRYFNVCDTHHGERFFIRQPQGRNGSMVWTMTPLFLALIMIEIADVIFAVDSVPAIFTVTKDPFIVYTSNIFAILGLRAIYFALAAMVDRFQYLKYALAIVLIFVGLKVIAAGMFDGGALPPLASLGITLAILAAGVVFSILKTSGISHLDQAGTGRTHGRSIS